MLGFWQKILRLAAVTALCACSGGNAPAGAGAGGDGGDGHGADATAWITGKWKGTFAFKSDEPDETPATAEFIDADADEKGAGTFTITLPKKDDLTVKGDFQDFANKSLMLTVKESSISALGIPGSTTRVDY